MAVTCSSLTKSFPSLNYLAEHDEQRHHSQISNLYHFKYAVHDPVTGDEKSHNEVSDGHGTVKGTYSLVKPDSSTRVVEYTAGDVWLQRQSQENSITIQTFTSRTHI